MIRLDPKPGTIFLTRDAEFESKSYYAFIKAGGKIQSNGYRVSVVVAKERPDEATDS